MLSLSHWIISFDTGRKKNVLKNIYLHKALNLIKSLFRFLQMKVEYPEQFTTTEPTFKSDLHIMSGSHDLGIIGLAEIAVSLHLSGKILGPDGKPASLTSIAKALEQTFNVSFGNIYNKRLALFNRKRYNQTKTLDMLKAYLIKEGSKAK